MSNPPGACLRRAEVCSRLPLAVLGALLSPLPVHAADETAFIESLPVVLSGSRLAQPLRDVPGAMTVIDRATIRQTGARDLADILRWVPGFQVAQSTNGNSAPLAVYHGLTSDRSTAMQVLVDGRTQYSPLWFGGVNFNVLQVAIEDIERIEILRGSNSAAFGSNAMLGVVNIVTTEPVQAQGKALSLASSSAGGYDVHARLGWGDDGFAQRLSLSRSFDDGIAYFRDSRSTRRAEWRGDLRPTASDEWRLIAGEVETRLGIGLPADSLQVDDPERDRAFSSQYLQVGWTHQLHNGDQLALRYFHVRESGSERFVARSGPFAAVLDFEPRIERHDLEAQHTVQLNPAARLAWGASWRHDAMRSQQILGNPAWLRSETQRLFAHLEWRLSEQWLANLGGTWEHETLSGKNSSPRLMISYQPDGANTVRAGVYRAHRTPSFFEQRGNNYVNDPAVPTPPGTPLAILDRSDGGLKAERLDGVEISYLGEFAKIGLSVDARAFDERLKGRVLSFDRVLPGACVLCFVGGVESTAFVNGQDLRIRGFEYQLRWRTPWSAEVWFNHTNLRIQSQALHNTPLIYWPGFIDHVSGSAPHRAESIHWLQTLPGDVSLTVSYAWSPAHKWTKNTETPGSHRLDWRLGIPFRAAWGKGELSWTARADNAPLTEYRYGGPQRYKQQVLDASHWLGLRLEF